MVREFSVTREISRREVERHTKRFIGVTVSEPAFKDQNGLTEWSVDIRVGVKQGWAVIKDCLVAQWALGVVTDMHIPVVCERSESGRVTVIARSEISLPDIVLDEYTFEEVGFSFMRNLRQNSNNYMVDGFGHEFTAPNTDGDVTPYVPSEGAKNVTHTFNSDIIEWGSTDFEFGFTDLGKRTQGWREE